MKKFISIILLLTLGYYIGGNLVVFSFLQNSIRKEVKNFIKNDLRKVDKETIVIHKNLIKNKNSRLKFIKNDEFRFDNKLYDIISATDVGDSIKYSVFNDSKEECLINNYTKLDVDNLLKSGGKGIPHFKFNKYENLDKIKDFMFSGIYSTDKIQYDIEFLNTINSFIIEIPDPPPDFI